MHIIIYHNGRFGVAVAVSYHFLIISILYIPRHKPCRGATEVEKKLIKECKDQMQYGRQARLITVDLEMQVRK